MAVIKLAHLDTAHHLKCICQFLRIERYRLRPHVNKIKIHTLHCHPPTTVPLQTPPKVPCKWQTADMLSPQAHISTPPPYHTHHQTNACFLWFIHLKQAKTVSQSTFGFQGSLRLAWHHATINHLQMTDDTLELRAADMPVPAQDTRQIPFVCLFFISCHSAHHCAICAKQHLGRPDPKIHTTPSVPQLDNAGHLRRSQWTAWQVQRLLCMFVGLDRSYFYIIQSAVAWLMFHTRQSVSGLSNSCSSHINNSQTQTF